MTITVGTSAITFNDSTTMTTAAVAGPPGPTGPTGSAGPTGPAGSSASVVTTYGAVGSYVIAGVGPLACCSIASTAYTRPNCTVAGACLYRSSDRSITNGVSYGASLNAWVPVNAFGRISTKYCGGSCQTNLSLSGTWRAVTTSKSSSSSYGGMNLLMRIS